MTDDLTMPLEAIEEGLRRLDRNTALERLQPGVPARYVRSTMTDSDLKSSPDVEALYGWKNGTSTSGASAVGDIHFFPGFYFLPLEDAVANYKAFIVNDRWEAGWLPIFANGGGDFYILDLQDGSIRHFRLEENEHPVEFESLYAMLTTLAVAFDRKVIFVDSEGYLEMDDLVFGRLSAELNPEVAWWRS